MRLDLRIKRVPPVFALAALSACYSNVPVATFPPAEGQVVEVQLSPEGQRDLASLVGPKIVSIDGKVLSADTAGLRLGVTATNTTASDINFWNGEPLAVRRIYIDGITRRKLSPARTAGFVGLLSVAGLVLRSTVKELGGNGRGKGTPPVGQ